MGRRDHDNRRGCSGVLRCRRGAPSGREVARGRGVSRPGRFPTPGRPPPSAGRRLGPGSPARRSSMPTSTHGRSGVGGSGTCSTGWKTSPARPGRNAGSPAAPTVPVSAGGRSRPYGCANAARVRTGGREGAGVGAADGDRRGPDPAVAGLAGDQADRPRQPGAPTLPASATRAGSPS